MAITYTSQLIGSTGGTAAGSAATGTLVVAANTRCLWFVVAADCDNTAALNVWPSEVSWNGINATPIEKIVNDTVAPFGRCQFLYRIDNPTPGSGTARVNHATQHHHQFAVALISPTPITPFNSGGIFRGNSTSPAASIATSVGDSVFFSIAANANNIADVVAQTGSTQFFSAGDSTRQTLKGFAKTATGTATAENWTLANSSQWSVLVFGAVDGVFTVDSINGSSSNPSITIGSNNSAATSGLGTITSATLTDANGLTTTATPNMPSGDGTFIVAFPYADGSTQAKFGAVTASLSDGVHSASMSGTTSVPAGILEQTWDAAYNYGPTYLGSVLTLVNGNKIYYPDSGVQFAPNGAVILSAGATSASLPVMLHDVSTGLITTKTINISITGEITNIAPVVSVLALVTRKNISITGQLVAIDADGDTLTYSVVSQGTHGVASVNSSGVVSYVPANNYIGTDSFTVAVSDGHGHTTNSIVSVVIANPIIIPSIVDVSAQEIVVTSNAFLVTGVDPGIDIPIVLGALVDCTAQFAIDSGSGLGAFGTANGNVRKDYQVKIKMSANAQAANPSATVLIGGVPFTFSPPMRSQKQNQIVAKFM